ncbi:cation channel sperm-associated protein 4 isoform X3 [Oryx dammah]|uniref:cation channel sperm-associated protein 4 isoform X3 n=1 Tax=Oryx dammah TaxID=59534 RepID=UPI001A9BE930|nr:cation channel sperm-associated protein 4 isoform X3 [Oryx dammah]
MADNQRSWWQQWTDTTYIKPLNRLRAAQEPYRREEQVLINRRDITSRKDAWDMQEFITRMYVKQLLRHPASKVLLAVLLVVNAITIALRTNSTLDQKHYELFSTIDDIVLTTLICELLLGWLNGFWIFWKCRGYHLHPQVFSVFGITLFGVFVPMHFQNMQVALYTLFICITQDGWVDIYSDFQMETGAYGVEIGGAIYFATFITIGAFIGINLLVVVVTTNLEQMMKAEQGQQHQIAFSEVDNKKGNGNNKLPLVHCAVARSEMSGVPQEPFMGGPLTNLSERTCDNFCLVLEAIQENLMRYKEIRDELNTIVDEVRSIRFNQEQEEELMQRHLSWNMSLESRSSVDIREMTREQDLITALVNRKKVQLLSFPLLPNQCPPHHLTQPSHHPLGQGF